MNRFDPSASLTFSHFHSHFLLDRRRVNKNQFIGKSRPRIIKNWYRPRRLEAIRSMQFILVARHPWRAHRAQLRQRTRFTSCARSHFAGERARPYAPKMPSSHKRDVCLVLLRQALRAHFGLRLRSLQPKRLVNPTLGEHD